MRTMATIKLPPTLTVEDDEEYSPNDPYGDPVKKIVTIKFGDFEVARYELTVLEGYFGIYYDGEDNRRIMYDTPEEFLAEKLKKLFKLID
jgi:hypothetical protein